MTEAPTMKEMANDYAKGFIDAIDESLIEMRASAEHLLFTKPSLSAAGANLANKAHATIQCAMQDLRLLRGQIDKEASECETAKTEKE